MAQCTIGKGNLDRVLWEKKSILPSTQFSKPNAESDPFFFSKLLGNILTTLYFILNWYFYSFLYFEN